MKTIDFVTITPLKKCGKVCSFKFKTNNWLIVLGQDVKRYP